MIDTTQAAIVMAKLNAAFGKYAPIDPYHERLNREVKMGMLIWNVWDGNKSVVFSIELIHHHNVPNQERLSFYMEYYGGASDSPNNVTISSDSQESADDLIRRLLLQIEEELIRLEENVVRFPKLVRQTPRAIKFMKHLQDHLVEN